MPEYDLIIRRGLIYDGSGSPPYQGDVAIQGDTIAAVGELGAAQAKTEINADGLAVAPGFINMLSWAAESLIEDGRSQSDLRQGVTLEVMGEGASMGPLTDEMKQTGPASYMQQGDIQYPVEWTTLGEYLEYLERRGVSCNVASFVGSETIRIHELGYANRPPTLEELDRMCALVRQAMEEGALGLSAALIYSPAVYATIDELIALAEVVSEYDGMYISHLRSEGAAFLDALFEFMEIVEEAQVRGEIYHLKAAGRSNWDKLNDVIEEIETSRAEGLPITANMYPYPFSGTGLAACIPPWAHEGGHKALIERLRDPETRARIKQDMLTPSDEWENMYLDNTPETILLAGFRQDELKPLTGKTLADVAAQRGASPEDTLLDLIVEDDSRVFALYFSLSEDNLRKQIALPWVSFCSDAPSLAPEGVFLKSNPHPRAYGSFARVLATYVREEKIITLEEAIRRLTSFPAANLKLDRRGALTPGYFADVVVFDPDKVQDYATPENPHQYSTGMVHVLVNGVPVLHDGEHTGAKPGRVVRGPGWNKKPFEVIYPPALLPFLTIGPNYNGTYTEFNLGPQHIPDLIRLATDFRLHYREEDAPQSWAPMHACRVLGQLQAVEAAKPLTRLFDLMDVNVVRELPVIYGMIGPAAIPALKEYLAASYHFVLGRALAIACLRTIAEESEPIFYDACEALLIEQLQQLDDNGPILNGFLVQALVGMESRNAIPAIARAYAAGAVEENVGGKWKDVQVELGLRPSDSLRKVLQMADGDGNDQDFDDDDDEPGAFAGPRPTADKKKKAKRKQAAKVKKQQRKKKR